jgi:hypothetical protein
MAAVEAKRKNTDVSGALQQAKRYNRGFTPSEETALHPENWGAENAYRLPFVFSSNGRPFLRQLATKSGIWFCDVRRKDNLGHALDGWYTPEGLTTLLKRDEERALVRDQFVAKLRRKQRHLSEANAHDFETHAGMSPDAFLHKLRAMPLADIAAWFTQHPGLGEILDRKGEGRTAPIFISEHSDQLLGTERGYGKARKPDDYLNEFTAFISSHRNDIPALLTVLTRPRELTRK